VDVEWGLDRVGSTTYWRAVEQDFFAVSDAEPPVLEQCRQNLCVCVIFT